MFSPKISQWVLNRHTGLILRHGWKEGLKNTSLKKSQNKISVRKCSLVIPPLVVTVQNKQSRNQKDDIELIKKKWIPSYGKPKQRVC